MLWINRGLSNTFLSLWLFFVFLNPESHVHIEIFGFFAIQWTLPHLLAVPNDVTWQHNVFQKITTIILFYFYHVITALLKSFSVNLKDLNSSSYSLSEVTVKFFAEDYRTGYARETKSPIWREHDERAKKKIHNEYSLVKRVVRLVLMHADSFPQMSNNRPQYKQDVFALARPAEERIREALGFSEATITRRKLEKQPGLKELEDSLKLPDNMFKLPDNTPDDWRKYFKGI